MGPDLEMILDLIDRENEETIAKKRPNGRFSYVSSHQQFNAEKQHLLEMLSILRKGGGTSGPQICQAVFDDHKISVLMSVTYEMLQPYQDMANQIAQANDEGDECERMEVITRIVDMLTSVSETKRRVEQERVAALKLVFKERAKRDGTITKKANHRTGNNRCATLQASRNCY